jgi:hypothetical protein
LVLACCPVFAIPVLSPLCCSDFDFTRSFQAGVERPTKADSGGQGVGAGSSCRNDEDCGEAKAAAQANPVTDMTTDLKLLGLHDRALDIGGAATPVVSDLAHNSHPQPASALHHVGNVSGLQLNSAPKKPPPPLPPSLPSLKVLIDDAIYDIKYSPTMNMDSLALQALRATGKTLSSSNRISVMDVEGRPLQGQMLVKEYVQSAGKDSAVLRLHVVVKDCEVSPPPKSTASVIAELLGFVVPSNPENHAFFDSLNSRLDRELISIDSSNAPIHISHPVAPVPSNILCGVTLHSSLSSRGVAGSTKKTFSWDSSITCDVALSMASAHWFPDMSASTFMFKAYGRFE